MLSKSVFYLLLLKYQLLLNMKYEYLILNIIIKLLIYYSLKCWFNLKVYQWGKKLLKALNQNPEIELPTHSMIGR